MFKIIRLPFIILVFVSAYGQNENPYHMAIEKADSAYQFRDWGADIKPKDSLKYERALIHYRNASNQDPDIDYPVQRINEIEGVLWKIRHWETYKLLLEDGENLLNDAEFGMAKSLFLKAYTLFPSERLKNRIEKIELILRLKDNEKIIIDSIHFGDAFGLCTGFCMSELRLKNGLFLGERTDLSSSAKEVDTLLYNSTVWNQLIKKIGLINILTLEDIIGCPDCLDQGAEWIEIYTSGKAYRVEYDFGSDIALINYYQSILRKLKNDLHLD